MQNGNVIDNANIAVKEIAAYGMSKSAKSVKELIQYAKALDNNQKSLIKLILKYQRVNKELHKLNTRMYIMMNTGQRNVVDSWFREDDFI